jgi:hypothetical protein
MCCSLVVRDHEPAFNAQQNFQMRAHCAPDWQIATRFASGINLALSVMKITWNDLSFLPSDEALTSLREAWAWFLPQPFEPVLASTLGDVFFQQGGSEVYWLNTGTAEITRVAETRTEFMKLLRTEKADEWFMPVLIEQLKVAGKILKPDGCYTYVALPIFSEGKYEVSNMNPVSAAEHFGLTGEVHRQVRNLPDGSAVKLKWT